MRARAERRFGVSDIDIWRRAVATGAVIVTQDDDFRALLAREGGAQVLWLRFGNCTTGQLPARMDSSWPEIETRLAAGEGVAAVERRSEKAARVPSSDGLA